ncbi:MAG: hypothetical protein EBR22_04575 [Cytophagia bacterium]|nr:hypothetical protein [Cytophagia bacterium]
MRQTYIIQGTLQYQVLNFLNFFYPVRVLILEFHNFVQKKPRQEHGYYRLTRALGPIFEKIFPLDRLE